MPDFLMSDFDTGSSILWHPPRLRIRVRIRIKEMPETLCRKGFQVNNSPKGYNLNNRGFHPRKNAEWFSNPAGVVGL